MAIVQIKPIDRERWHGKKNQEAFARPVTIEALVSTKTNQYVTGISEERRLDLESTTGYDLSPKFNPEVSHPTWGGSLGQIKLEHGTNILDTSKTIDEIRLSVCKASPLVANSQSDLEEGLCPEALFIIFDESEEVEVAAKKLAMRDNCVIAISKLNETKKIQLIMIILNLNVKGQSTENIRVKLEEALTYAGPEKFLNLIKGDASRNTAHFLLLDAVRLNIVNKKGSGFFYMDHPLGLDLGMAINFLLDPENASIKAELLNKLNNK